MKKMIFFLLSLIVLGTASMNVSAQVTIGRDDDPHKGAVLDLQGDGSTGFRTPRVYLTSASVWLPVKGSAVEGMMVFNSSSSTADGLDGAGIYVWVNGSWSKMGTLAQPCEGVVAIASSATSFIGQGSSQTLGVVLSKGSAPYNYIWRKGGTPVQETSNTSSYRDTYTTSDYGTYTCEVTNFCQTIPQIITFTVSDININDYNQDTAAKNAGLTWSLSGITCFNVSAGQTFPATSPYTVSVGGGGSIKDITWVITDTKVLQSGSASKGVPTATLSFKDRATVSSLAPAEITVTAQIILTKNLIDYKVASAVTIKFQNQPCCEGAIIKNGAYSGPGPGVYLPSNIEGRFVAGWTHSAFTALSKDLCWNKSDAASGGDVNWVTAMNVCTGGWRAPNLKELQVLYEALGGTDLNGSAGNFSRLKAPNTNPGNADAMRSTIYWSSTEVNSTAAFTTSFYSGGRIIEHKETYTPCYIRCVKTL